MTFVALDVTKDNGLLHCLLIDFVFQSGLDNLNGFPNLLSKNSGFVSYPNPVIAAVQVGKFQMDFSTVGAECKLANFEGVFQIIKDGIAYRKMGKKRVGFETYRLLNQPGSKR